MSHAVHAFHLPVRLLQRVVDVVPDAEALRQGSDGRLASQVGMSHVWQGSGG